MVNNYTIVLPQQTIPLTNVVLLALTLWREASNQTTEARQALACVVRNRVLRPGWWGRDWTDVVTKHAQFTSMTMPGDPNLVRWPVVSDPIWADCVSLAFHSIVGDLADPTGGATSYYDKRMDHDPPKWAASYVHTADIGDFHFYKEKLNG